MTIDDETSAIAHVDGDFHERFINTASNVIASDHKQSPGIMPSRLAKDNKYHEPPQSLLHSSTSVCGILSKN